MQELLYLLRVPKAEAVAKELGRRLLVEEAPTYVRVATIAPLSNHGYAGYEGALLRVDSEGLVLGIEGHPELPRAFIPWSNVAYLADGSELAKQQAAIAAASRGERIAVTRGGKSSSKPAGR